MRRVLRMWATTCVLAGMCVVAARGQESTPQAVPRLIRFNGVVRQVGEQPARGVVELSFSLFKEEAGGEPLWFESQTVEVDAQGRYNVLLGAMHADGLPMDLFTSGEARWLSIMVGKAEQPRVLLVSVPYALKAADAESLGGKPATAYVASDQLKSQVESSLADPKIGLRTLNTMVMASSGGTTTPPALVNETVPATFTCTSASNCILATQNGTGHALAALSTAASGATFGVLGSSASSSGRGVFGQATSATGTTYGVRGLTASTSGYGLYGAASAATGVTHGVAGTSASTSGRGVFGDASALTGSTFGIFGQAASVSGVGLQGSATAVSGTTTGVRAVSFSPAGTAAVFDNLGGGKLISARTTGFVEKFSVDGGGHLVATATTGTAISGVSTDGPGVSGSSSSGTGVYGTGASYGVWGTSVNTGVYGTGLRGVHGSGTDSGVYGTSANAAVWGQGGSTGVYGVGTSYGLSGNGGNAGVFGVTNSGSGVHGQSDTGSGVNGYSPDGVAIKADAVNGTAGWFHVTNTAGKILRGTSGAGPDEIFTVLGNGNVEVRGNGTVAIGANAVPGWKLNISMSGTDNTNSTSGLIVGNGITNTAGNLAKFGAQINSDGAANYHNYGLYINNANSNTTRDGLYKYGLYVINNGSFTGAAGTSTRSYGLYVAPGSGADLNYGAYIDGSVGIGTLTPSVKLQVAGDIRMGTSGTNGCLQRFDGASLAGACSSDLRLKTNIQPFAPVLHKLAQLQPVQFNWRAAEFPAYHFGGGRISWLIAQEVERLFPELVAEDDRGYKTVNYSDLPVLMLQGIRELKSENDGLKDQVEKLTGQLTSVLARLAELETARK